MLGVLGVFPAPRSGRASPAHRARDRVPTGWSSSSASAGTAEPAAPPLAAGHAGGERDHPGRAHGHPAASRPAVSTDPAPAPTGPRRPQAWQCRPGPCQGGTLLAEGRREADEGGGGRWGPVTRGRRARARPGRFCRKRRRPRARCHRGPRVATRRKMAALRPCRHNNGTGLGGERARGAGVPGGVGARSLRSPR